MLAREQHLHHPSTQLFMDLMLFNTSRDLSTHVTSAISTSTKSDSGLPHSRSILFRDQMHIVWSAEVAKLMTIGYRDLLVY